VDPQFFVGFEMENYRFQTVSVYRRNAIRQSETDHVQRASGTEKSGSTLGTAGKLAGVVVGLSIRSYRMYLDWCSLSPFVFSEIFQRISAVQSTVSALRIRINPVRITSYHPLKGRME
jgi:hypothetical protein